jgi:ubiquinone/menaquinone biosynthesis C-methylase UbiE
MNRNLTNAVRFILDEFLPPILRDNKYLMYPLFWIWYKGKHVKKRMEFKTNFHTLTSEEYKELYSISDSLSHDRPTDLNQKCIDKIINQIADNKDQKVVDVGCGRGYFLKILQKKGFTNIHGTDLFDTYDVEGVNYTKSYIENMVFEDNSFDTVICSHTIEHIPEAKAAINELKRIAKKQVIITVPCQRYYHYTFDLHIHFFPIRSYLIDLIDMENYECNKINGDWVFIGYK